MPAGRPTKYNSIEELERIVELYFLAVKCRVLDDEAPLADLSEDELQIINDVPDFHGPTISGLAYTLDMTTETLRQYELKDEFSATIKKAKQKVENALEGRLYGAAPAGVIFNLKNNFGWKDKTETEHSGGIDLSRKSDAELLAIINDKD